MEFVSRSLRAIRVEFEKSRLIILHRKVLGFRV